MQEPVVVNGIIRELLINFIFFQTSASILSSDVMGEIKSVSTRLEVTEEIDDDEARSFFRRFPFPQLEVYVASVKKKIQSLIKSLLNLFLLCHEYLKPHGRIFFRVSRSVHARITVCS